MTDKPILTRAEVEMLNQLTLSDEQTCLSDRSIRQMTNTILQAVELLEEECKCNELTIWDYSDEPGAPAPKCKNCQRKQSFLAAFNGEKGE